MVTVFSWLALSVSSRDCLSFFASVGKLSALPWPCSGKSDHVTSDRIFIWTWGGRASLAFFLLGKTESARLFLIPPKEGLARLPDFEAPILPSFVSLAKLRELAADWSLRRSDPILRVELSGTNQTGGSPEFACFINHSIRNCSSQRLQYETQWCRSSSLQHGMNQSS